MSTKTIRLSTLKDFSKAYAVMYSTVLVSPKIKYMGIAKPTPKEIQIDVQIISTLKLSFGFWDFLKNL
jgi:hypothetical protein